MSSFKNQFRRARPAILVTVACWLLFAFLITTYLQRSKAVWEKDERTRLMRLLINKRSNLESELYARIYYTKSVAAYVSLHPDIGEAEYDNLAAELIQNDPVINTMALAKDAVITAIFPKEGHEAAIGLDLLAHPRRREIVEATIQTKKTFVAGPVELVEGGIAFISYTPIFDKTKASQPFWGMTDIVIKKDALLEAAVLNPAESDASFALRGTDGRGSEGGVFFGDPSIFEQDPVTVPVQLPDGEWILAAVPQGGWAGYLDQDRILALVLIVSGTIIATLVGLFAGAILRIREDKSQMRSIFEAMTGCVIELDQNARITWIAATRQRQKLPLLRLSVGESIKDSSWGTEDRERFTQALARCIDEQSVQTLEVECGHTGRTCWMMATLSPKGADHAILVLQEITEQKTQQIQLAESEAALKRLNDDKDLLFSIIAHDLRTPSSAVISLSELLLHETDHLDAEQQRETVELIYKSAKENLFLLENLLTWAHSQQDGLEPHPERIRLRQVVDPVFNIFSELAALKNIRLESDIPAELEVVFDRSMLETVLRNLVSNALKFTPEGGHVQVGVTRDQDRLELFVRDNGIGMDPENIERLSSNTRLRSTGGTAAEGGTGLGLSLCRRFLDQHGQNLRIESRPGEGTTVYCSLKTP
ncbi:MAG: ATP-binding protein [Verrucomicrobiota bacterium]